MSAIQVLKKDIISYEEIRKSGKKCLTTNNEECCFVHYPEIKEALLALEQKEKLSKWLDDVEGFETKEFRDTLEKSLFGKLVGTCKVREIMNLKKELVGEQK